MGATIWLPQPGWGRFSAVPCIVRTGLPLPISLLCLARQDPVDAAVAVGDFNEAMQHSGRQPIPTWVSSTVQAVGVDAECVGVSRLVDRWWA